MHLRAVLQTSQNLPPVALVSQPGHGVADSGTAALVASDISLANCIAHSHLSTPAAAQPQSNNSLSVVSLSILACVCRLLWCYNALTLRAIDPLSATTWMLM